jgi:hypothetical protein
MVLPVQARLVQAEIATAALGERTPASRAAIRVACGLDTVYPIIGERHAVVCVGSSYRGRDLLLINPTAPSRTIAVFARDAAPCITVHDTAEDEVFPIRIHRHDAKKLFGDRILGAEERAILYPSP